VQPQSRWKILVVDSYTKTLLNSVLKMYDILQQNVSTVESIESHRPAQSTFEAAYLLCPTSQNVERIIRELAPEQGKQPQYAAGHLFFVDCE
jgi:syntaxin-binding protein 1